MSKSTNNRRISFDLPADKDDTVIEVSVRYSKDDHSFANDRAEQQGYWVNVTPVNIRGAFRTITAYQGEKAFHESAKRYSRKKLEEIFDHVKSQIRINHSTDRYPMMLHRVLQSSGLRVVSGIAQPSVEPKAFTDSL